jgi:hypothetical protein
MLFIRGLFILALALVTLEVLTGATRDPLPPVARPEVSPAASEAPLPTPVASATPTSTPPTEPVASVLPAASCYELQPPLLTGCPGEQLSEAGWAVTLSDGWAAISADPDFLPSLFGAGSEAGPFLNELGARGSARGISAVILGRVPRSIELLGLGDQEAVARLLAQRYPDRVVSISSYVRLASGRLLIRGTLTRAGLSSPFMLLAIPDRSSLTRIALAWAPWSSFDDLYAVIGDR